MTNRKGRETLQSTVLNVLTALVGVDKLQLRLKSFEVEDAMESWHTLRDLIAQKAGQDLRSQLTQIAGSLTMLGSPIGLARKVGSGVKAFFYEPYLGAVHGSQDFVIGLGKGTTRLISGVVSGAMDSAAAIADTATKGFSYLSGDADYIRERSLIKQQFRANRAGIIESINYGSEVRSHTLTFAIIFHNGCYCIAELRVWRGIGRVWINFQADRRRIQKRFARAAERNRVRAHRCRSEAAHGSHRRHIFTREWNCEPSQHQ